MSKSFFRRRHRKNKKKLSESLASLDTLQTQVDETLNYEDQLQLHNAETARRYQTALEKRNELLEKIREKSTKLAAVNDKIEQATTQFTTLQKRKSQNIELCDNLEIFHNELPSRMWKLQVQLSRAFAAIEETKKNIAIAFHHRDKCREKLDTKREELLRKQIQIKSTKEKVAKLKRQLQKAYDSKKVKEFQQKSLESMVVYVMQMNLRAVNSRTKMVERRGKHLEKMLTNTKSELCKYTSSICDIKKKIKQSESRRKLSQTYVI